MVEKISWWEKHLEKKSNWWLLIIFLLTAVFMVFLFLGMIYFVKIIGFNIWSVLIMIIVALAIFAALGFMYGISTIMEARIKSE